ncbi:LmbE family protein [Pseudopedobacter saltans DSM 12145]|uniref:LmbE family protein n=1 Tax=Pseudopedobacter saltans (strain ATCC 51119 / DSM 12145 / JCM 21818 / CCUG 39354 / LMG 10337 / NBRC 100064 / NCIMB 13643) TaxID=762903 RepID=F0SA12_PSESL|nr:bacillithiol biosynthesis deacetylase BshB1 [Pseudopedobacter saltans]ADY52570.1 LmbE family protein [Pseudopedobacter saltans DSM 12145]
MKLDLLYIAAHPDDVELGAAGTVLKHKALGRKVGVVDLTRGELGTRGTVATRAEEAKDASAILGLDIRENLGLRDGFFKNDEEHQLKIIEVIRKYKPEIIITNAYHDRHPDHGRASELVTESCFLAGLPKIKTQVNGAQQEAYRPRLLLHFIQDTYIKPDIVVDISAFHDQKIKAIQAYKTQFYVNGVNLDDPQTYISNPDFLEGVIGRAREFGKAIQVPYAEGFLSKKILGIDNLFDLK